MFSHVLEKKREFYTIDEDIENDRLYADMDTTEGQKKVSRMAKERENNSKDIYQSNVIKDEEERVLEEGTKSKQKWRMTLDRSIVQRLKWLSETWSM